MEDFLSIKLLFKKGNTDTLQIKDIRARVFNTDGEKEFVIPFEFPEINKLRTNDKNIMDWSRHDSNGRKISLAPGESFHLGRYIEIPAGTPVIVEAALHGTRTIWGRGFQWRASVASLPVKK